MAKYPVMPRNGAPQADSDGTTETVLADRRTYLKAAGTAAASVPLLGGEAAGAVERRGMEFGRVVNMVEEMGCDPTGGQPCDGALRRAAGSNTLLVFPAGTYYFTDENSIMGREDLGIVGRGNVTFTVPENFNRRLLKIAGGHGLLVENITIDQTAAGATPGLMLGAADGLQIRDVEVVGRGIHPALEPDGPDVGDPDVEHALDPIVESPDGEGVVENFVARNEGLMGSYGRGGVFVGRSHKGTLTFRNCHISGFSGNGMYASRTPGTVQVEGGTFRNNDLSQVRIGSPDSYVRGATIEVDTRDSNSPNPRGMLNGSGVRLEGGGFDLSGAQVLDCDITIAATNNSDGGVVAYGNYGDFAVENSRIQVDVDRTAAIKAHPPGAGGNVPSGPTAATIRNVSMTGTADHASDVLLQGRPDSVVEGCCIHDRGASRVGVLLEGSDGTRVANSTINASQRTVLLRNTNADVSGIDRSGSCPAPNAASAPPSSAAGSGGSPSSGAADAAAESAEPAAAASEGGDDSASSADAGDSGSDGGQSFDAMSVEVDAGNDGADSSGSSEPSGSTGGSQPTAASLPDGVSWSGGTIATPELNDAASAEEVVVAAEAADEPVEYELSAAGEGVLGERAATTEDIDTVSADGVSGQVAGDDRDSYAYTGEQFALELDDRATIKVDEDERTITVTGNDTGRVVDYSIEVSGDLEHADDSAEDRIDDDAVDGAVASWYDRYSYTGAVLSAGIDDAVSATFDAEE